MRSESPFIKIKCIYLYFIIYKSIVLCYYLVIKNELYTFDKIKKHSNCMSVIIMLLLGFIACVQL